MCMKDDKNATKLLPLSAVTAKFEFIRKKLNATAPDNEGVIKRGSVDERRILTYFISFAGNQFRDKSSTDLGICYVRDSNDSIGTSTFAVDLNIVCYFHIKLGRNLYNFFIASCEYDILRKAIYHYVKVFSALEQLRLQIDLERSQKIDTFGEEKKNEVFEYLSDTGTRLCDCLAKLADFKNAVNYCDTAIPHAKRVGDKETKAKVLQHAIMLKGDNLRMQKKYIEAKIVYEECYNLVAEAYYVDHPLVLEAANGLVSVLMRLKENYDAER
jgi:tetratricopeptide (TPR) repeat protein